MSAGAESPLRVFHCDFLPTWAGGQRQVLALAQGLRERGHRQWLVTPVDGPLAVRARAEGLDVIDQPHRRQVDPRMWWRLWRAMNRFRPQILHAHESRALMPCAVLARLVRGPRPAVVGHRRVDFPIRRNPASRWKWRRGADRVVAVSEAVAHVAMRDGIRPDRLRVIRDGIPLDDGGEPPDPLLRDRIRASVEAPLVLTIAVLKDYKDHPTLIRAAGRLHPRDPATRWVVLGDGPLLQKMRAEVAGRGLAGRVHYLGFDPLAQRRLPEANVFALTSKTEGLGSSLLDAMVAGVPVVATGAGGIPELIEHDRSGLLVPPGDAGALASAIDRLLDDAGTADRIRRGGRRRVRSFDISGTVRRTERLYREILAAGGE